MIELTLRKKLVLKTNEQPESDTGQREKKKRRGEKRRKRRREERLAGKKDISIICNLNNSSYVLNNIIMGLYK